MGRRGRSKKDREADFRAQRERNEQDRREREIMLQSSAPPKEMNWDEEKEAPVPQPVMNPPVDTLDEEFEDTPDEIPPEMPPAEIPPEEPPAPLAPKPTFSPQPQPTPISPPSPMMEDIPPEMPPEDLPPRELPPEEAPAPEIPPVEDTYEEDLLDAEEREQLSRDVEQKLEESFRESDEWWKKWNDELEDLMKN